MENWILKGSHTEEGLLGKILIFVWSLFQNEKKLKKNKGLFIWEARRDGKRNGKIFTMKKIRQEIFCASCTESL